MATPEVDVEETSTEEKEITPVKEPESSTKDEKETGKKSVEEVKEELIEEIELLAEDDERTKHGKYALKVGESTYYGNTKREVIQNLMKGKEEQDGFIRKVKISEKVKAPTSLKEDEVPQVELPNEREIYVKHLEAVTKQNKVDIKMLDWQRDDWNKFQDDNLLRDYEIAEMRQLVRDVVNRATELTKNDMAVANVAYINNQILEEETQSVREMLAESGIDEDKFDYDAVLEVATKKRGKSGVIQSGAITAEAGKQITRIMKQGTPVKKDLSREIEKGKDAKRDIKSPTTGDKPDKDDKKIHSYDELARIEKKALGRAGREI